MAYEFLNETTYSKELAQQEDILNAFMSKLQNHDEPDILSPDVIVLDPNEEEEPDDVEETPAVEDVPMEEDDSVSEDDMLMMQYLFEPRQDTDSTNVEGYAYDTNGEKVDLAWLRRKSDRVNLNSLNGNLSSYLNTLPEDLRQGLVATSGNDQEHVPGSKHYSGNAIDLRFNEGAYKYILNDPAAKQFGVKMLDPNHGNKPHIHLQTKQAGGAVQDMTGQDKRYIDRIAQNQMTSYNTLEKPKTLDNTFGSFERLFLSVTGNTKPAQEALDIYNTLLKYKQNRQGDAMPSEEKEFRESLAKGFNHYPSNFTDLLKMTSVLNKEQKEMSDRERLRYAERRKYFGVDGNDQTYITNSKYKPSVAKNNDIQYYDFSDEIGKKVLSRGYDYYSNAIDKTQGRIKNADLTGGEGYNPLTTLGNFKMSKGSDDRGEYISYYDMWDIDPEVLTDNGVDVDKFNYPFEVYGRMYKKDFPAKQAGGRLYNPTHANQDYLFNEWYSKYTLEGQHNIPYSDKLDYDYYSFYRNNEQGSIDSHFPDTYKRPRHITFSDESLYSTPENRGGHWYGDKYVKRFGGHLHARTEQELSEGLNNSEYRTATLALEGLNTIRGLDNYQPVAVTDGSKYQVLYGPNDTAQFKGNVYEKRL